MNKLVTPTYWQNLSRNEIKLKALTILPKFVFIILIILIVQTFSELTWQFFAPAHELAPGTIKNHDVSAKKPRMDSGLNKVAAYHLFGNAKKPAATQQKVIDAPDTRLHLILKGVFAASNPKMAIAIIATKTGDDKSYHIGDELDGGALLHAVYADRVILKRNGNLETLRLPKVATENLYNKSIESLSVSDNAELAINAQTKQKLKVLRTTLLTDPGKIWKQVRINPVMKNGKISGYSVVHNDTALMKSLGLRKTDVIIAVNGELLSDPATLYGLLGTLSKQQNLAVTIERNGKQQEIQVTF